MATIKGPSNLDGFRMKDSLILIHKWLVVYAECRQQDASNQSTQPLAHCRLLFILFFCPSVVGSRFINVSFLRCWRFDHERIERQQTNRWHQYKHTNSDFVIDGLQESGQSQRFRIIFILFMYRILCHYENQQDQGKNVHAAPPAFYKSHRMPSRFKCSSLSAVLKWKATKEDMRKPTGM